MSQFRRVLPHFCAAFLRLSAVALLTFAQSTASNAQVAPTLAEKLAAPRPIAAVTSPWLDELTWMEVRDLIAAGTTTVIIPTGGIEENGPFLTTGKHNVILEALCPAIASKLRKALCAPIVKFVPEGAIDPPSGPMRFPGSISLRESTFEALLVDIAASLRQAGFIDIIMIGDNGRNQNSMARASESLNEAWQDSPAQVHFIREFYDPGWEETEAFTRRELGVDETRNDGHHDDIWVTAMMAVTDPQQIRFEQRQAAGLASINGVVLEPLEDTVTLGKAMIEFRAAFTAEAIRRSLGDSD